jgi:hypothetical protein
MLVLTSKPSGVASLVPWPAAHVATTVQPSTGRVSSQVTVSPVVCTAS